MRTQHDDLNMAGKKLTGLPTATNPTDAVPFSQLGSTFRSGSFRSGFYSVIGNTISTSNTLANAALRMYAFAVGSTVSLTRMGAEVTAAGDAGSVLRLGVYADDGGGFPGLLVLDAGSIAADAVAVADVAISLTLTPGIYWVGGAIQGVTTTQPTIRTVSAPILPVQVTAATLPSAGQTVTGCNIGGVTGALPGSVTPTALNSGSAPRVFFKAA